MTRDLSAAAKFALGMDRHHLATVMYPPDPGLFRSYKSVSKSPFSALGAESWPAHRKDIGLYLHLPFCASRCNFCEYAVVLGSPDDTELHEAYVDSLLGEVDAWLQVLPSDVRLTGVDIGGGTPTLLEPSLLARVLAHVRERFDAVETFEMSIETTPEMVGHWGAELSELLAAGVSRISMGVQSMAADVLEIGGRGGQTRKAVSTAMDTLRRCGFEMINLDLMFAQLGQDPETWRGTLQAVIELEPDVVTAYDTVYKGRAIARNGPLPRPAAYADGYDMAWTLLRTAGYDAPYGSVNFSRVPGRLGTSRYLESRILELDPYVGVGLYASSLVRDTWAFNIRGLEKYCRRVSQRRLAHGDVYALPRAHVAAKLTLGMLSYGFIDGARYRRRLGETLDSRYGPELAWLESRNLIRRRGETCALVPGAFGSLPGIRATLMPAEVLKWIGESAKL